jgi:O-antigen ligase
VRSATIDERRPEPVLIYSATPGRAGARWLMVAAVGLAPLAIGCRYPSAYVPLLAMCFASGTYSLYRERKMQRDGVALPPLPAEKPLLALTALALFQLIPFPPAVLAVLSPGSFEFYNAPLLLPLRAWKPISASPADTLRGVVFLVGMGLLYRAAFRELDDPRWRRRLVLSIVAAGFVMTVEALVQEAYSAHVIYGIYHPVFDWAVFGPYVNRNQFAGYMLMATPLAFGLCAETLDRLRHAWGRRRRRAWLALGDPEGNAFLRHATTAMVLVTGLLATKSRGGLVGLAVAVLTTALLSKRRWSTLLVTTTIVGAAAAWIGLSAHAAAFATRSFWAGRAEVWMDLLRLFPRHPVFGVGFNALPMAYPPRQHVLRTEFVNAAHNEYLQGLLETGVLGALLLVRILWPLVRRGWQTARQGPLQAGLFAAIVGVLAHNLVDYNWQVPANAATFVVLAGIAVQAPTQHAPSRRRHR